LTDPVPSRPAASAGRLRRSLRHSFLDGIFYAMMFGVGDTYLAPYALALGADAFQVGLLTSIPGLAASLVQVFSTRAARRFGPKRTMLLFVLLQGVLWLPILAIPWLFADHRPLWLVLFVTLSAVSLAMANPAWIFLISRHIPPGRRGAYFGFRNRWSGVVTLLSGFAAGIFLWRASPLGLRAFAVLFGAAFLCRMASWLFLARMHETRLPEEGRGGEGPAGKGDAADRNFMRFALFAAAYSFAAYLAAPFFPVLMLQEFRWDYLTFVTVNSTLALFTFLSLPAWGRQTDRVGNVAVLGTTGLLVAVIPLLWFIWPRPVFALVINALAGFAWSGFNLAVANFVIEAVPAPRRMRAYVLYTLLNGIGICLGSLLGGALIPHLPPLRGSRVLAVCILSCLARLTVWGLLLGRVKEARRVPATGRLDILFGVVGLRSPAGMGRDAWKGEE
jgi:MFS family permease